MKRIAVVGMIIISGLFSSCAIFINNEDDDSKKKSDNSDTISIVITHTNGINGINGLH
jgi:hypothetical protein